MTTDTLLTAKEAGAILRCGRTFLTVHAAELGGIKVGSRLKFRSDRIERYIAERSIVVAVRGAQTAPARHPVDIAKHRSPMNPVTKAAWGAPAAVSSGREGRGR